MPAPLVNNRPPARFGNYGPKYETLGVNEERGVDLPTGIDFLAGGVPTYAGVGVPLTPIDYLRIAQTFPTAHAVENKGTDLAALDVRVWAKAAEAKSEVRGQRSEGQQGESDGNGDTGTAGTDNGEPNSPAGLRGGVGQPPRVGTAALTPAQPQNPKPNTQHPAPNPGVPSQLPPAVTKTPVSKRAQKLQDIFDHSLGLDVFMSRAQWSYVRGIMFWQVRLFYVENVGVCFDLTEGERNHPKAGGRCRLHPDRDSICIVRTFNPWAPEDLQVEARVDRKGWIVVKPLGGARTDGDENIAVQFNQDAKLYEKVQYSEGLHVDRFGVPISVLRDLTEKKVRPTKMPTKAQENADAMRQMKPGGAIDVGLRILEHSEVKGDAAKILLELETRIEGRCERRLNGTALLSDTRATGPTGSSNQARTTKNQRTVSGVRYFQDLLSNELLPYIIEQNDIWLPGNIPPLGEGELPPFVVMTEHGMRDEDPTMARDPAGPAKPPDKRPLPSGEAKKDPAEVQEVK